MVGAASALWLIVTEIFHVLNGLHCFRLGREG
jgi:hypothetical protein